MRNAFRVIAAVLGASTAMASCGSTTPAPPLRTVTSFAVSQTTFLTWGEAGAIRDGVTVRALRPVVAPAEDRPALEELGRRELLCDIEVVNGNDEVVRIGVSGHVRLVELLPGAEPGPAVEPRSTATIRRSLLAPFDNGSVTLHVAATVGGRPVPQGWQYAGVIA
ncbi:hypothetical protein JNUCC0626_20150 [Lentzea sp. JNUCC 0626]|uniref:hypothetical protein n=1 Tax=Lentzea sp. JNUCC 0626 TaxID=3367513 RepID=UPI003748A6C8